MRSIEINYQLETDTVEKIDDTTAENWIDVCEKFNDDVHRIKDIDVDSIYSGLYECFDDNNKRKYYLVEEAKELFTLRRKNVRDKLGL